jgi:hypothetical protein
MMQLASALQYLTVAPAANETLFVSRRSRLIPLPGATGSMANAGSARCSRRITRGLKSAVVDRWRVLDS